MAVIETKTADVRPGRRQVQNVAYKAGFAGFFRVTSGTLTMDDVDDTFDVVLENLGAMDRLTGLFIAYEGMGDTGSSFNVEVTTGGSTVNVGSVADADADGTVDCSASAVTVSSPSKISVILASAATTPAAGRITVYGFISPVFSDGVNDDFSVAATAV